MVHGMDESPHSFAFHIYIQLTYHQKIYIFLKGLSFPHFLCTIVINEFFIYVWNYFSVHYNNLFVFLNNDGVAQERTPQIHPSGTLISLVTWETSGARGTLWDFSLSMRKVPVLNQEEERHRYCQREEILGPEAV